MCCHEDANSDGDCVINIYWPSCSGVLVERICVKDNLQPIARNKTRLLASNTVTVCLLSFPPLTANTVCFARLELS